jgi:hypothetical protein
MDNVRHPGSSHSTGPHSANGHKRNRSNSASQRKLCIKILPIAGLLPLVFGTHPSENLRKWQTIQQLSRLGWSKEIARCRLATGLIRPS